MSPGAGGVLNLSFTIGRRRLTLPLDRVEEVVPSPGRISPLPLAPAGIRGLMHIQGQMVAVLDIRRLLGMADASPLPRRLLLMRHGALLLGLPVDALHGLCRQGDGSESLELDGLLERALAMPARLPAADLPATPPRINASGRDRVPRVLVSFIVGTQEFALPLSVLRRAAMLPARIVALPHAPTPLLGMGMVGDRVLPLVALRPLLGLAEGGDGNAKVLVVTHAGRQFGLVVDRLRALLHVDEADVEPVPALFTGMGREVEAVCRLEGGRRLVSLLSPSSLLIRDGSLAQTDMPAAAPAPSLPPERQTAMLRIRVGEGAYALPLDHVAAVTRPGPLTPVPHAPDILAGLGTADGVSLPVIDLRRRLDLPVAAAARHVVTVTAEGRRFGILVDLAAGVQMLPAAAIGPAPSLSVAQARLITRVVTEEGGILPILEPSRLAEAVGASP